MSQSTDYKQNTLLEFKVQNVCLLPNFNVCLLLPSNLIVRYLIQVVLVLWLELLWPRFNPTTVYVKFMKGKWHWERFFSEDFGIALSQYYTTNALYLSTSSPTLYSVTKNTYFLFLCLKKHLHLPINYSTSYGRPHDSNPV